MSLDEATRAVMGYVQPRAGSELERALNELREKVLRWIPPGFTAELMHSAPPPRPTHRRMTDAG